MPRARGFRDPHHLNLKNDFYNFWTRVTSSGSANPHISRLRHTRVQELRNRAARAQQFHLKWRYSLPVPKSRPLNGFVFAIKDNITTLQLPTTCASKILGGFRSAYDARVVKLLRDEGALITTKTNMDEFGMGSHSTNSAFGPVKNGRGDTALSVGGSSGGSAYAVAAEHCHIALGTDTGGSVRLPAAYLGLVGFKPSYGLLSRNGVVPYANSLDAVGMIAKDCLNILLTFQILNAPDPNDPTCLSDTSRQRIHLARQERRPATDETAAYRVVPITMHANSRPRHTVTMYPSAFTSDRRRRIGFPLEYNVAEMHPLVRVAWTRSLSMLQQAGHEIVPISLPSTKAALSAYYVLAPAEASSNLAKYDGVRYGPKTQDPNEEGGKLYAAHRGAHFGDEAKRRILLGAYSLSADAIDNYFIQAQKVRRLVQQDFDMVFRMKNPLHNNVAPSKAGIDLIVCPTAPTPPPRLSRIKEQTPLDAYMNDVFTVPASLAGLPAISVPAPIDTALDNDPARMVGMQIIGQYGDDFSVINFAKSEFESTARWDQLRRLSEPARMK